MCREQFEGSFSTEDVQDALPYGMASFNGDIAKLMVGTRAQLPSFEYSLTLDAPPPQKEFIENPPRDPIREAQQELDSVKSIMTRNVRRHPLSSLPSLTTGKLTHPPTRRSTPY